MKKTVSFLLCIVMILTGLPMVSWAAEEQTVTLDVGLGRIVITGDGYQIYDDKTEHVVLSKQHKGSYILTGTADLNCIADWQKYVEVKNTTGVAITMKDLNIVIPEELSAAAFLVREADEEVTVDLTLEGTNVLTAGSYYDGLIMPRFSGSVLNIDGTGSLTCTGGPGDWLSDGIYGSIINVSGGTVEGIGGNLESSDDIVSSCGILADEITVSGTGSVTGKGGTAKGETAYSCGLTADALTAVDGATIEAVGGTAIGSREVQSVGAWLDTVELTSGASMEATGGSAQSSSSQAMVENGGLKATTGEVSEGATVVANGGSVYGSHQSSFSAGYLGEELNVDGGIRCQTAKIDHGSALIYAGTSPESIGMEVSGEMTVGERGSVASRASAASSIGYGIAVRNPLRIDGGEVSAIGVIDNGGAEETTTGMAIYHRGAESPAEPAVIMTGGTLTAESARKEASGEFGAWGATMNGTVDLSGYGDYCWRTEQSDLKFRWSDGEEQRYVNGSDYAALQIQSSIPVELDPNGGTVEPDLVQMGRHDTADDLPTPKRSGYAFLGWYTEPDEGIKADSDFVFDDKMVLYAHWQKKSGHSSGSSSGSSSSGGDQPAVVDPPQQEGGDSTADCDHGSDCSLNQFGDVNNDAWYRDGIDFCVTNGLMSGTGDGTFAPHRPTSRAMLVTILYQLEGRPEAGDNGFADVNDGTWYSDAVSWAAECGIAGGIGNDRFAPDQALTREQLAVILYQYAKYKGYDVSVDGEADLDFTDDADVSGWARIAVKWAVQNKLINGVGSDRLSPRGQATRAQMATILYQFCRIFAQNVTK